MVARPRLRFSSFLKLFLFSLFCTLFYRRGVRYFHKHNAPSEYNYEQIDILVDGLDDRFLFFNRVPKTGSELVTKLLQTLGTNKKTFVHKRYGAPQPRKLTEAAQVSERTRPPGFLKSRFSHIETMYS